MDTVICHICLRTDITTVNIATELTYFIEELCDHNIIDNPRYKYCTICAHLLKKFYNFKKRCLKACKILKSLKGRCKILPTNLHEQIPSSIGFCSSLAPYKLLEHQHHTNTDLLETKPDISIEPNITPNNAEVNSKQNLETVDPTLPGYIEVKDEPMDYVLDSDIDTMQVADSKNIYNITTSDGNFILNFEEETKIIKLEENTEELNTDGGNKDGSKDNANQSKIKVFLRSSNEEIRDFDDNNVEVDNLEIKDTMFMLNNNILKNYESLNSKDDIESDISDCDVESLPMDEQSSESDSDSLSNIIEETKNKKIYVNDIDLELAETLLKVDKRNNLLKRRIEFLKRKANLKDGILKLFENDEYDLGDGVKISKAVFLKIYERCEKSCFYIKDTSDKNKAADYLRTLYKMYNPEYETVFDIEYLDTEEKKLQEFNRRKDRAEYQNAPYQCTRCYKGFRLEWQHATHIKKHDESSGAHECHICTVRFFSARTRRGHKVLCHSAVYVCRLCHVTFYYLSSMLNHFNLHKGKEFPCPICNGIYRSKLGLANHRRTHVTSHICTTCAKSFVSAQGLLNHRRLKHKVILSRQDIAKAAAPAGAVRCAECPLALDSQKVYEKHLRISHRTLYTCRCKRSFLSMAELRRHKVEEGHQHSYKKPENVGPSVNRKSDPGMSRGVTREKVALRTCPICQEEVPNDFPTALYIHHKMNHPGVPYKADRSTVRNYLCEECGKQFISYALYLDHKNIHSGARPYVCRECPRAFATAINLCRHAAWHRPPTHKCKFCGKLFKARTNLSFHMRIHKNDRRYKCDVCSASFLSNGALKEHIRGVHHKQRRVKKINNLKGS